ncbi:MAG: squalene synthase HpnC [Acidimicrobiia bacterium]|nr:squalene synthase HpnC [Acidimicrobiia bacterium]MYC57973.1 squalene synthase HpnC [Acidimicrobiia bacterium]MYG94661.1 squalene synthase HpnC [Acidimicrobiia bacterium]MYI31078.1 squalene synthase HpnC [Acidimicrobiia bacterium]
MAQKGNENFSVALRVLPARQRSHLLAIYGFARLVDDIGDELVGNRLAALDWLEAELRRARSATATHPVMRNLTGLLNDLEISDEPFLALIEANRRDQCKNRYQSQAELAEYCMLSANPVGWLVLAVFGVATPDRIALSDAVCTGLQIIEHLQDLGEDYTQKQRIYMPADEMVRFGVAEADLSAERASPQLCQLVAHQVSAARGLVNRGKLLVGSLNGWVKVAVAGYVAGGLAALDAISVGQNDVLSKLRSPARIRIVIYMVGLLMPPSLSRWVRR